MKSAKPYSLLNAQPQDYQHHKGACICVLYNAFCQGSWGFKQYLLTAFYIMLNIYIQLFFSACMFAVLAGVASPMTQWFILTHYS